MKLISIISLIFLTVNTNQPLSFNDLIFAYENNLDEVTALMNKKEFSFEQTTEVNNEKGMVWKYNSDNNSNSVLFLVKYCFKANCGGIHIQTDIKEQYFSLKKQALKYGFKYDGSEVSKYDREDAISFFYYFKDYALTMSEGKTNKGVIYTITLRK